MSTSICHQKVEDISRSSVKIIHIILAAYLSACLCLPVWATDYYGCATASINSDSTFCATPSGSCAGSDAVTAATALQAGNNLYANGCALSIGSSFTSGKISTEDGDGAGAGVAGGGFTITTGTITVTSNITAGTTDCLTVSGGTVTVAGNINGSAATANRAANRVVFIAWVRLYARGRF